MRKALATSVSGPFVDLHVIARPGLEAYAKRHGWELVVDEGYAPGRPAAWAKIEMLWRMIRRYELVAWLDADALIIDGSLDLAAELRRGRDLYLVEHRHPETGEAIVNTGVGMLRAGRWAERFLAAVWAQEQFVEHKWWDNAAVMHLLGYRYDPLPARRRWTRWARRFERLDVAWNTMPHLDWSTSPAPRVLHFGGLPLEERRARMLAAERASSAGSAS